ncbi:MAG: twin-arginine translocase subunit TatC [Rikenellaceae bacterium]
MSDEIKKNDNENDMSFGEHFNELRIRIIKSVVFLFVFAVVAFVFKGVVLDVVFAPLTDEFPTNRFFAYLSERTGVEELRINAGDVSIINTKMAGQFNLHIMSSIFGALVVTVPYMLWQIWAFVKPALTVSVRRKTRFFVLNTSMWFFTGLLFGYFIISPLAVNFLTSYEVSPEITNMIDVSSYLSSVLGVSFAAAFVFQLPLIVRLLSTMGILKSTLMRKYRKVAFVVIIIISAVITPPDVFSLILITVPLYGLYEYGITIAARIEKNKQQVQ